MHFRNARAAALAALVLAACDGDSTGGSPVPAEVRVTEAEPVLAVGTQRLLDVTVLDARGRVIADAPVRFASSRPEVVGVDSVAGVMTARTLGHADVTVTAGPARATVPVQVQPPGGVAVAVLAIPGPRNRTLNDWPGTDSIPFAFRNAAGVSLCGAVPVQVESADSAVARASLAVGPGGGCAVSLEARSHGFTVVRLRAGALADSVVLQVKAPHYHATLARPARKTVGTVARWSLSVRTDEEVPVPGVVARFRYTLYAGPGPVDTVTVLTGPDGRAELERSLPTSARNALAVLSVAGELPDGKEFLLNDDARLVSGPAERLELRVLDCFITISGCSTFVPGRPIELLAEACDVYASRQMLLAAAVDRYGNPTSVAPTVVPADPEALVLQPLSFWFENDFTYYGSQVRRATLAPERDSARVTVSYPGLPSETVELIAKNPC